MEFSNWLKLDESSATDLYQSAVAAFPNTAKRQHATQPIVITNLHWTPYIGMKTLFVKGLAQSEGKEYNPIVVFKNVNYRDAAGPNVVGLTASDNNEYFFEKLDLGDTDIVVRCNCPDFYWRFNYFDHIDGSLYGRKRAKYEALYNPGSANPQEMPGMCKHLMKLTTVLKRAEIFED
jgi:hypothetical protein